MRIATAILLCFVAYTSQAEGYRSSSFNWNSSNDRVESVANNSVYINADMSKSSLDLKGSDVQIVPSRYKKDASGKVSDVAQSIFNFKSDLRLIRGRVSTFDADSSLDSGLVYAGKKFYLGLSPRHQSGNTLCNIDVDFGDKSKVVGYRYREAKPFSIGPYTYSAPGVYTLTIKDHWSLFSCRKYNLTIQIPVFSEHQILVEKQKRELEQKQRIEALEKNKVSKDTGADKVDFLSFAFLALLLFYLFMQIPKSDSNTADDPTHEKDDDSKARAKVVAAAALAARLKKPEITPPPGYRVIDMKLTNKLLVEWTVYYVEESNPNTKKYLKAKRGLSGVSVGGVGNFRFKWSVPKI